MLLRIIIFANIQMDNSMRRVFGLGETVLDLIFKDDQPIGAKAGGSALNALVSLARMGANAHFITEVGNDRVGDWIVRFLEQNDLSTEFVNRFDGGKSALALAFLNENNDADYEFFKDYPSQRLVGEIPDFTADDIIVFGSFFGINPVIRPRLLDILSAAKKAGAIIIYDPNFRKHHDHHKGQLIEVIEENFRWADIVRGSDEDFKNIYGLTQPQKVYEKVSAFCDNLVVTANSKGVYAFGKNFQHHFHVPVIAPISTIGAGDNFNAGMMKALLDMNLKRSGLVELSRDQWQQLAIYGIEFSSEVCQNLDNYVAVDFKNRFFELVGNQLKIN